MFAVICSTRYSLSLSSCQQFTNSVQCRQYKCVTTVFDVQNPNQHFIVLVVSYFHILNPSPATPACSMYDDRSYSSLNNTGQLTSLHAANIQTHACKTMHLYIAQLLWTRPQSTVQAQVLRSKCPHLKNTHTDSS